jgi:hypothetical protein
LNFRLDEIAIEEDDDSSSDGCEGDDINGSITQSSSSSSQKKSSKNTVEDAFSLVHTVEKKMGEISNVLSSMDKRMAYNLRLIGSVTYDCHSTLHKDYRPSDPELIKLI